MNIKPDISVLMPAHNSEKYIRDSIESVLIETRVNLELVIVNDRSIDTTNEIIQYYANSDPRVIVINRVDIKENENKDRNIYFVNQQGSSSLTEALNLGIKFCQGKYIARLDSDDIAVNNRFLRQFNFMESNKNIDFLGSSAIRIDENGNEIGAYHKKSLDHKQILYNLRSFSAYAPHPSWFVKKDIFNLLDGYDQLADRAEDLDFMLRLSEKKEFRFGYINEPLIKLRMHSRSLSYSASLEPIIYAISAMVRHRLRTAGKTADFVDSQRSEIYKNIKRKMITDKFDVMQKAYNTLRFSYIALKTGNYLKGLKGIAIAFSLSPSIVLDYRKIRNAKQNISDHVVNSFCKISKT